MEPSLVVPESLRAGVVAARGQRTPRATEAVPMVWLPRRHAQLVVHATPDGDVRANVSGPSTRAAYKFHVPGPFYVQVVVRPEVARAVLGVPVHEVADRVVALREVWGRRADDLVERVAARVDDPQAALGVLEAELARRMRTALRGARLVGDATARLARGARVAGLADDLGISERTLRQAFLDHVGLAPKRYARVARVLRVVADAGRASWAQLAAEHGFYDQAHLNAEFRALLRVSPGQYLARQLPFVRGG